MVDEGVIDLPRIRRAFEAVGHNGPMASARGSSNAVEFPTQSASVERSRSSPSSSKSWLWR